MRAEAASIRAQQMQQQQQILRQPPLVRAILVERGFAVPRLEITRGHAGATRVLQEVG